MFDLNAVIEFIDEKQEEIERFIPIKNIQFQTQNDIERLMGAIMEQGYLRENEFGMQLASWLLGFFKEYVTEKVPVVVRRISGGTMPLLHSDDADIDEAFGIVAYDKVPNGLVKYYNSESVPFLSVIILRVAYLVVTMKK